MHSRSYSEIPDDVCPVIELLHRWLFIPSTPTTRRPPLPEAANSRVDETAQERRALYVTDWVVRTALPTVLSWKALAPREAAMMRGLAPLDTIERALAAHAVMTTLSATHPWPDRDAFPHWPRSRGCFDEDDLAWVVTQTGLRTGVDAAAHAIGVVPVLTPVVDVARALIDGAAVALAGPYRESMRAHDAIVVPLSDTLRPQVFALIPALLAIR